MLAVFDNKTAMITPAQDRLFPFYSAQVSWYAEILRAMDYGETDQLGIVYWQPTPADGPVQVYTEKEIAQDPSLKPLDAVIEVPSALTFDIGYKAVDNQLQKQCSSWLAQAVAAMAVSNQPKGKPGCPNCNAIGALVHAAGRAQAPIEEYL
jgi:hypothetical protein